MSCVDDNPNPALNGFPGSQIYFGRTVDITAIDEATDLVTFDVTGRNVCFRAVWPRDERVADTDRIWPHIYVDPTSSETRVLRAVGERGLMFIEEGFLVNVLGLPGGGPKVPAAGGVEGLNRLVHRAVDEGVLKILPDARSAWNVKTSGELALRQEITERVHDTYGKDVDDERMSTVLATIAAR